MIFFRHFLTVCMLVTTTSYAQNHANVWMLANQFLAYDCGINFNSGIADTFSVWKNLEFFGTNAGICDTSGQLLMYTNAIKVNNRNHELMLNSEDFNPGQQSIEDSIFGLSASQGVVIVPMPGNPERYYIFHISGEEIENGSQTQPLNFRYSVVDMGYDSGLGGMDLAMKGIIIVNDTLVWGRITACKHANGSDWWIITHKWNSNLYYKFLLTSTQLIGPIEQEIGSTISKDDIFGQACFSPDGKKFTYMNRNFNFDYMEFDRCTGLFSSPVNVTLPDSILSLGVAFSANSRFIYCTSLTQILQYDTWNADLQASMIIVDTLPINQPGIDDWYATPMLAPDNKIYITTYNSVAALHVIDQPDSLGFACNSIRQGFKLPTYNLFSLPNHPNYDLGSLPDADSCYLIYTNTQSNIEKTNVYKVFPNPSSTWLNIIYQSEEDGLFELFDLYGKRVAATSLFHYFKNRLVNVGDLPVGVYLAVVTQNGEKMWSEKVVIQH